MSRTPNSEQLLAIEHRGGVLLRAGAGSGKTFVLVEHIVYLTGQWIMEFKQSPQGSFEEFIRQKFSQVVMMTFTKKAAGEMNIRLTERFGEISNTESDEYWKTANESLPLLLVTTIDGFCRKLITSGYFPHLSTEAKVIFDRERTDQVRELVDEWFHERAGSLQESVLEIVIREKKHLLKAFTNVFNDPGLRLKWKKFSVEEVRPDKIGKLLSMSFELNDLSSALSAVHTLEIPEESERSAFERNVALFQSTGLPVVDSVEKFMIYADLFARLGPVRPEATASKKDEAHKSAHEGLKELKKWTTETWGEAISDYREHFDVKVLPWINLCLELYHFIEGRLDPNQGMTFGDIEYFVSLGLENAPDRERIQYAFRYFIVDEFQDTSAVQFKIIESLMGSDFNRLFCVGDAKQAIYGFRGGELSVFQDCESLVPEVRTLANNYRSLPEIIGFNNSLFKTILPLGQEFRGHDLFSVVPEDQNVPSEVVTDQQGAIEVHRAKLAIDSEIEKEFSTNDINRLEAMVLADSINNERIARPQDVCTVLYQRLKPSGELIRALMGKNIGFTAQFKIDLLDDPILGMFLCLLKRQFDSNDATRDRYPLFLFKSYFSILNLPSEISKKDLNEFDLNVKYWGIVEAFRKFLHKLCITNENFDINIDTIETISLLFYQDPEAILVQLSNGNNERLSLELRSGENSHMVQIMSAHASKGLEFDTVYLAGIFTNGKDKSDGSLFGDLPGSFIWYLNVSQREKRSSPLYVFENELSKYKSFSESKRLFYVACTRARKKLVWVDFEIQDKKFSLPRNAWINGLRTWLADSGEQHNLKFIDHNNFDALKLLNAVSLPELPLFFHDPMGIYTKGKGESELLITPELSVTRLNSLLDCPRKFYLANVLKLSESSNPVQYDDEDDELAGQMRSSSARGTYVHALIAEGINRNFTLPVEVFGGEHHVPVEWALDLLKVQQDDFEMISERPFKFKFFNFMISGIPDLILLPKGEQAAQVWDFKTGRISQENLSHYWLQLSIYAYALYELGKVPLNSKVELVLCFVDQREKLAKIVERSSVKEELYPVWRSQNAPWNINPEHCTQCFYGDICPR